MKTSELGELQLYNTNSSKRVFIFKYVSFNSGLDGFKIIPALLILVNNSLFASILKIIPFFKFI